MTADQLAAALGARRAGAGWIALCPAHNDRNPSLSINIASNGKVLVHCHAGCGQDQVVHALRARGCWGRLTVTPNATEVVIRVNSDRSRRLEKIRAAARIWQAAIPAPGTPVAAYLRRRGITTPIPRSLRFHPDLRHPNGKRHAAMVAVVTDGQSGIARAVHRTFLSEDGSAKANVSPQRMFLGPSRGGAVRLAAATDQLMVGEGIETCLTAMQATGRPVWAALSAAGLRTLELPGAIREVIILADGDDPGEAAALEAANRWKAEGRVVRIARAPRGSDFNDVLLGRATLRREGAA